jgi:lactate dehydrogenase-like 2-hydroxyacid dehydrogenase
LQEPLFGAVLKRGDWSMRMVQALADKTIGLQQVGPAFQHRLRRLRCRICPTARSPSSRAGREVSDLCDVN